MELFLSTPSARRATHELRSYEEDVRISIHALREEGDLRAFVMRSRSMLFLSTPSARRATTVEIRKNRPSLNFYPRPPRGGRLVQRSLR